MSASNAAVNIRRLGGGGGGGGVELGVGEVGGGGGSSGGEFDGTSQVKYNAEQRSRDSSPMRKNTSSVGLSDGSASASTLKKKRKPNVVRSAAASRETSPIRSGGTSRNPHPQSQSDLHQPRPHRPLPNAPHWPTSSRLAVTRTPPPDSRSPGLSPLKRTTDLSSSASTIVPSNLHPISREANPEDLEELAPPSGMRTPRSNASPALETVVESSLPTTPTNGATKTLTDQAAALVNRQPNTILEESEGDKPETSRGTGKHRTGSIASSIAPPSQAESESESGYKSEERAGASNSNNTNNNRAPPTSKPFSRRPMGYDNFSRNMTVETEVVVSVPQVTVGAGGVPGGASIRSKKSTDTIRAPKKEKKKAPKRSGAGGPANPSSKSDIFALKIAEAVDEANSSDSEETFVYESNPPEPPQRPTSRFHSRTPSATSIQGGPDPRALRLPQLTSIDGNQSTGRKGMKFANTSINSNSNMPGDGVAGDGSGVDRGGAASVGPGAGVGGSRVDGQTSSGAKEKGGNPRAQNGHRSILPEESPFHNTSSHKTPGSSLRVSPTISSRQSQSPRHNSATRSGGNGYGSKKSSRAWAPYEADVEGADDERVPLINRTTRVHRHSRRPGSGSLRQLEHSQLQQRRGWLRTYIGCIVAVVAVLLIMTGVGGFLFATTKALQEVKVLEITGVLVSKQELMLDLVVQAVNPNAIPVVVGSMDVNLFAKSAHVGDGKDKDGDGDGDGDGEDDGDDGDSWLKRLGTSRRRRRKHVRKRLATMNLKGQTTTDHLDKIARASKGIDQGTDPADDLPEQDRQTMLLGRIFSFDSALTFDGSPLRHKSSKSVGELRLAKPGNKTEEGGTERWERVLQHPFELIVRGVLKYQLPLSGRVRTAPIGASVLVHPDGQKLIQS